MTSDEIDRLEAILIDALRLGAKLAPPPLNVLLPITLPVLEYFVRHRIIAPMKIGIANGTIVSDGHGGFVPATNSRYDPKTGEFID
jgi:hypothetical protein